MKELKDDELKNINGGMSVWAMAGIGMLVTLVAGIIDGIARPVKCRS